MDLPYWTAVAFGFAHLGILGAILFKLGHIGRSLEDHERRLNKLED